MFLMINDLDFNKTDDCSAINGYREINSIKIFVRRSNVNSVLMMFMGTRENIVLPNDSMSPLMH